MRKNGDRAVTAPSPQVAVKMGTMIMEKKMKEKQPRPQPRTKGQADPIGIALLIEASYRHLMGPSTVRIVAAVLDHAVRSAVEAMNSEELSKGVDAPSKSTVRRHFDLLNEKYGWSRGLNPQPPAPMPPPPGGWRLASRSDIEAMRPLAEARARQLGTDIVASCRAAALNAAGSFSAAKGAE